MAQSNNQTKLSVIENKFEQQFDHDGGNILW